MPYFQRPPLQVLQDSGRSVRQDDIVQVASAILDRETRSSAGGAQKGDAFPPAANQIGAHQIEAWADQFRRQAGELVEKLVASALSVGLPQSAPPILPPGGMANDLTGHAPVVRPDGPVKAGGIAALPLTVTNTGAAPVDVSFYSSDLVSDSGFGIPAWKVTFSPRTLALAPQERQTVQVQVAVPGQAAPGEYAGLIRAAGLDGMRAVLAVPVD